MSIWIAQLLGPIMLVLSIHMVTAPRQLQETTEKFLENSALIFVSGVLAMLGGLTIINTHNIWVSDWRVIITVFGWLFFLSGASRILLPQVANEISDRLKNRPTMTRVAGLIWGVLGCFIVYKGYF